MNVHRFYPVLKTKKLIVRGLSCSFCSIIISFYELKYCTIAHMNMSVHYDKVQRDTFRGSCGCVIVGFTTTYRHLSCELESCSWRGLSATCSRSVVLSDHHDIITKILLKVVLNTLISWHHSTKDDDLVDLIFGV